MSHPPRSADVDVRGIAAFLAMAFGLSWVVILVGDTLWHGLAAAYVVHCTAMLMPGVACFVVRLWLAEESFDEIGIAWGGLWPCLAVVSACLLLWGVPRAIDLATGGQMRPFSYGRLLFTAAWLIVGMIPAFGEELGWRGYLLPKLLPIEPRKALLLHGAIWGAWHWPLLFAAVLVGNMDATQMAVAMAAMVVVSMFLAVIVGWLWLRSGSIFLVTLWHHFYDYFRDMLSLWFKGGELAGPLNAIPVAVIAWYAAVIVSIVDALSLRLSIIDPAIACVQVLGVPLLVVGVSVRILARRALGREFSFVVQTTKSHRLVRHGVYAYIRHPAYLGTLSMLVAFPICLGSLLGLGIAVLGGIPALLYRLNVEERALRGRFGEEYAIYARGTKKLIPFLW